MWSSGYRSARPHHEKKYDMIGSSVSNNFAKWGIDDGVSGFVNQFELQGREVSLQANKNLSGAEKELMC